MQKTIRWFQAAPLKASKKKAEADLAYCITDPVERAKFRIIKSPNHKTRWVIQGQSIK